MIRDQNARQSVRGRISAQFHMCSRSRVPAMSTLAESAIIRRMKQVFHAGMTESSHAEDHPSILLAPIVRTKRISQAAWLHRCDHGRAAAIRIRPLARQSDPTPETL